MRLLILLASLTLGPALAAPPEAPAQPKAPENSSPLDGVWRLTHASAHGQEVPPARFTGVTRRFQNGSLVLMKDGKDYFHAQYQTRDDRDPKQIDIQFLDGPNAGRTLHGIYEINGDVLRLCTGKNNAPAPLRFESTLESATILDTFQRQK